MAPSTKVTTLATLPQNTFLENLVLRPDASLLLTSITPPHLYLVPSTTAESTPKLLHKFANAVTGIVSIAPDVYIISTGIHGTPDTSVLYRLDMTAYKPSLPDPSDSISVTEVLKLPEALFLNGSTSLPTPEYPAILLADSLKGCIWRVDFPSSESQPKLSTWLSHSALSKTRFEPEWAPWPGVNGIKYHPGTGYLYATNSEVGTFIRIKVDTNGSFAPIGEPQVISRKVIGDDLIIDRKGEYAYVTTNPNNTLMKAKLPNKTVDLENELDVDVELLAGGDEDAVFAGPTAVVWDRSEKELLLVTNGGMIKPVGAEVGHARVLRVQLESEGRAKNGLHGLIAKLFSCFGSRK